MSDLKPCPFCGGTAKMLCGGPGNWFAQCETCKASSNDVGHDHAVELWNARHAEPFGEPVAWQACDTRYAVVNGIVTVQKGTVDAWRESGIKFTPLYAAPPEPTR